MNRKEIKENHEIQYKKNSNIEGCSWKKNPNQIEKTNRNLKNLSNKLNKDQEIKRIHIIHVKFKISDKFFRKQINKNNWAKTQIE
jgi:hypothetical protein